MSADHGRSIARRIRERPVEGPPEAMRTAFADLVGRGPTGRDITRAGHAVVEHGRGDPVLWLHGGGYVFGSPETHARAASLLAGAAGMAVHLPRYRLAPEHPWPAQTRDACEILDSYDRPLPVIGDSAGGHLALTLARHRPGRISALALISPNTDRTGQSRTRQDNSASDLMNSDGDDARLAAIAMPRLAADDHDASPLLADLSGVPPTFVTASTDEVLLDDALLLIRALARAGVPVTADIVRGAWHLWPLWATELRAADLTLHRIARFLREVAADAGC